MLDSFASDRLNIHKISSEDFEPIDDVLALLSVNVTLHLPEDWQGINTLDKTTVWLKQRLLEGDVFAVHNTQNKALVGLLFLYGLGTSEEVRIGYLIAEKFWRQGFASELVAALLEALSHVTGVTSVVGGVTADNEGSIKVLTKHHFHWLEEVQGTAFYQYTF